MIDLQTEQTVSLADAAEAIPWPGNRKPAYETIRRWADRGVRGHKLETVRVGGRRLTTLEAIQRFLALLSGQEMVFTDRSAAAIRERELRFGR